MPSSALVRQALSERSESGLAEARAALAVAQAVAECARLGVEVGAGAIGVSELSERTGLTPSEVSAARTLLHQTRVLVGTDRAPRIEPDLCCALPALAAVDWPHCRSAVGRAGGRMAPALAVVRETARLSRLAPDGGGEWISVAIQELVEETLYGRTAVTQALGELVRSGLLLRMEQPNRRGLRIRLHPRALGAGTPVGIGSADAGDQNLSARLPQLGSAGVSVEIGGASLLVPPGSRLRLPEGIDYRLEIGPDGGAIVRIDD